MAGYEIGAGGGDLNDLIRRAQAAAQADEQLRQKEEQRAAAEEKAAGAEERSQRVRGGLAGTTDQLATAVTQSATALGLETAAVEANTAAWLRNAEARVAATGGALAARGGVSSAAVGGAATAGTAAERTSLAEMQAINASLAQRRAAEAQSAREAEQLAASLRLQLAQARVGGLSPGAAGSLAYSGLARTELSATPTLWAAGYGQPRRAPAGFLPPAGGSTTFGGPAEARLVSDAAVGQESQAALQHYRDLATENAAAIGNLGARQRAANVAFQESAAGYAAASNALSRHGALTTEFIQALARGQVTLHEFGEQMTSTIGKFGGWAIAGAAVYGVYGLFKNLTEGATESQAAIQQLGRFIPGLGGPAGGGNSQVPAAYTTVRNISTEFNVPIKDVTAAMSVTARVFHSLSDAGDAARAVLAAFRLDQVSMAQSEQYLLGIAQSQGQTGPGGGRWLINSVIDPLNALQALTGARVVQTLPALARAAPAGLAAGIDLPNLEALVALGVRAGITGNQIGTALVRSMSTFAFTPASQLTFGEYGIRPEIGNYGGLVHQVMGTIDTRIQQGRPLSGPDLNSLARALGGPLLGSRTILPILAQEQLHPGAYFRSVGIAERPRPYQEDLGQVLGTVSERFKSIGISLQAFGNELAQSGLLSPLTGLLDAVNVLTHVIEHAVQPFAEVVGLFNELPTPLRDLIGILVAYRVARVALNTRFGGAAQEFVGRLPGLDAVRNQTREAVSGTQGRIETYLLPEERADAERTQRRLMDARRRAAQAYEELGTFISANAQTAVLPTGDPRRQAYEEELAGRRATLSSLTSQAGQGGRLEQESVAAQSAYYQRVADLRVLKEDQYSWADKAAYLEQRGYVAEQEFVNVLDQTLAAARARMAAIQRGEAYEGAVGAGGGGIGGGLGAADAGAVAAGVAATSVVAARAISGDQGAMQDISQAVAASRVFVAPQTGPATIRARGAAPPTPAEIVGPLQAMQERIAAPLRSLRQNVEEAGGKAAYLRDAAAGALPAAPFAGIIGAQLIGSALPGAAGNFATNQLTSGFTGALLGQMLGKGGPLGMGLGFIGGTVLGSFQQGAGSGIGSLAGGGIGAAIGSLIEPGGGTLIGGAIGSTIGSFVGGLFGGGGQSGGDIQNEANRNAQQALSQAGRNQSALDKFSADFSDKLATAFLGSGQSAQKAQASITSIINQLQAEVSLFGASSVQGRTARQQLDVVVSSALSEARQNPAAAAQVLQSAMQARQAAVQQQFTYALGQSADPQSAAAAVQQASSSYEQSYNYTYGPDNPAYQNLKDAQAVYAQALKSGSQKAITAARKALSDAQEMVNNVKAAAPLAAEAKTLAEQANAQQGYQAAQQDLASQGTLDAARAGGDQLAKLHATHRNLAKQLQTAYTFPGLSPRDRQRAINDLNAQLAENWTQQVQYGLQTVQAQGQLAVSQVPLGDTVGQARAQLSGAQAALSYMRQHRRAFDPNQITQMQAQVDDAQKQVIQTIADQARQLATLSGQMAAARDIGDTVAQANDLIASARQAGRYAIGPVQRAQAQLDIQSAINQAHQAVVDRVGAQTQLAEAQHPGDPIAQAQIAIRGAQQELAMARGVDEQIKAETALAQANDQYRQALAAHYVALGNLAASTTADPLAQLRDQIRGATRALGVTVGAGARITAETDLNNLKLRYQQEYISQRESTIQFQLDMQQITVQQAIQQYSDLLKVRDLTKADRQTVLEDIRKLQLGDYSPIGGGAGTFNLAPGNIRLPTFYDVAHAIRSGRPSVLPGGHTIDASAEYVFNIEVANEGDVPKVADALDRATSSHLRARLRAAGVTR